MVFGKVLKTVFTKAISTMTNAMVKEHKFIGIVFIL